MFIVFRVDASIKIGTGHVMRCLTLANQLKQRGTDITFICRNLEGNLHDLIEEKGFKLLTLQKPKICKTNNPYSDWLEVSQEQDAKETIQAIKYVNSHCDLLIVDHYALDSLWEKKISSIAKSIMVIDDLANRSHHCDFLLDQNYIKGYLTRYNKLVPEKCTLFLGPSYVLLREEFYHASGSRSFEKLQNIVVFFGGTDPSNETMKAVKAFNHVNKQNMLYLDVVIGKTNQKKAQIEQFCQNFANIKCHYHVENMAALFNKASLAIGAGGTTTWERCILGIPSIIVSIAENQEQIVESLQDIDVVHYLGKKQFVTELQLQEAIEYYIENPIRLQQMSNMCKELMKHSYSNRNLLLTMILQ